MLPHQSIFLVGFNLMWMAFLNWRARIRLGFNPALSAESIQKASIHFAYWWIVPCIVALSIRVLVDVDSHMGEYPIEVFLFSELVYIAIFIVPVIRHEVVPGLLYCAIVIALVQLTLLKGTNISGRYVGYAVLFIQLPVGLMFVEILRLINPRSRRML